MAIHIYSLCYVFRPSRDNFGDVMLQFCRRLDGGNFYLSSLKIWLLFGGMKDRKMQNFSSISLKLHQLGQKHKKTFGPEL